MSRFIIILILIYCFENANAGGLPGFYGARQQAMQGTSPFMADYTGWANNQANAAFLKNPGAAIAFTNQYGIAELNTFCMSAIWPTKAGNAGLNIARAGYDKFNEQQVGVAYSRILWPFLSIGVQFDYFRTYIADIYGKASRITFETGIVSKISETTALSLHVFNPARIKRSNHTEEEIPTIITAGASWNFLNKAVFIFESGKELHQPFFFRGGIEYMPVKQFTLRAGVNSISKGISAGIGYTLNNLNIALAVATHPVLPLSSHITIQYQFNKSQNK